MRSRSVVFLLSATAALAACGQANQASSAASTPEAAPRSCGELATLAMPHTTLGTETVAAGAFQSPQPPFPGFAADFTKLPDFCRVRGSITPSADSDIRFELWLPAQNWNGKFLQTGNGRSPSRWRAAMPWRIPTRAIRGTVATSPGPRIIRKN